MSTTTEQQQQFNYLTVDESELANRPTAGARGRTSQNPHRDAIAQIAGSGQARAFTVPNPGDDQERSKLVSKHTRWLRYAAQEHDRSVRVWTDETPNGLRITFQDKPYTPRERPSTNGNGPDDEEGPGE